MNIAANIRNPLVAIAFCSLALLTTSAAPQPAKSAAKPAAPSSPAGDTQRYWPEWRGPLGTGEAPLAKPPVEWSESKNVRWKVPIAGIGKSTPVVWNDLVFVTTAVPKASTTGGAAAPAAAPASPQPGRQRHPDARDPDGPHEFVVMALARGDGSVKWRKVVREELPHEGTHRDGTFASGSVIADAQRVYAYFGSRGLYALDHTGRIVWDKQFGQMQTRNGFGEGNSPTLHNGTLVVVWDHEGPDYVVAIDAATGKEKWRHEREEPTTWATPHVVVHNGKPQVVVAGMNRMIAYDLATGEPVWRAGGLTANQIPSPVSGDGMVFAMGGFRGNMLRAIKLSEAKGEITGAPAQAWSYERDTPYVPSPLLYRGGLYFLKSNSGILTNLDAQTGAPRYTERLESVPNVYASPVAADGRIYIVGREGTTAVLSAGPKLEVLATNTLTEPIDSSPALVDGDIFMRGAKHLYRISAK